MAKMTAAIIVMKLPIAHVHHKLNSDAILVTALATGAKLS
jgi:hypothetical protein